VARRSAAAAAGLAAGAQPRLAQRLDAKRGRPPKFGRPSEVVALTLPEEVVRGLRTQHPDLAWAIVTMFEKRRPAAAGEPPRDVELVTIAGRRSLIVVNRAAFKSLPGVQIVPLGAGRAFLALDAGRGMGDLEVAVIDRMESASIGQRERKALAALRAALRTWRHDRALRFRTRTIIMVERVRPRRLST
jgi:hypothetical protein